MTYLNDNKSREYYQSARKEILPLVPQLNKRVLEIGCGEGATLAWLRTIHRCDESFGVEVCDAAVVEARKIVDHVVSADIEGYRVDFPSDYFDLVLCLDVLEHLQDPWRVVHRIAQWLTPNGRLVASLPNVRYKNVVIDLALRGRFEYQDVGILDKTHLRFFTRASSISLLESADLSVVNIIPHPARVAGKWGFFNALSFGYFRDMFAWQFLIAAEKPPDAGQDVVRYRKSVGIEDSF